MATTVPMTSITTSAGAVLRMKRPSDTWAASPATTARAPMMLLMHTMLPAVPPSACSEFNNADDELFARWLSPLVESAKQ